MLRPHSDTDRRPLPLKAYMKRWLYLTLLSLFFLFSAIVLGTRYVLLPMVPQYRGELEALLSANIGREVRIGALQAEWHGIEPWVAVGNLQILNERGEPALTLPSIRASLSWTSLATLDLRLSHLLVEGADLDIRRDTQGRFFVAGLQLSMEGEGDSPALIWLLKQGDVQVTDARVVWTDLQRSPAALQVRDLQFRLNNVVNLHRAALKARVVGESLPRNAARKPDLRRAELQSNRPAVPEAGTEALETGTDLELQLRFLTPLLGGRPADPTRWNGEVYASVGIFKLGDWLAFIERPAWLTEMSGGGRAWVEFDNNRIQRVTLDPRVAVLGLYNPENRHAITLRNLTGRLDWQLDKADGQTWAANNVTLSAGDGEVLGPMSVRLQLTDSVDPSSRTGHLEADRLNLTVLAAALQDAPLPQQARSVLQAAQLRGTIDSLDARWDGEWQAPANIRVEAEFADLGARSVSVRPDLRIPGFSNLSGRVVAGPDGGRWSVKGREGFLELHDLLVRSDIPFSRLSTTGTWRTARNHDQRLLLDFDSADLDHNGMRVTLAGTLRFGRGEMPDANLSGTLNRVPLTDVPRYLPLALGNDTLNWLQGAIKGGVAHDGKWKLKGDLWHFPFGLERKGDFSLTARIQKGDVLFDGAWPLVRDVDGEIQFSNDSITITAKTARTLEAPLSNVTVRIPSVETEKTDVLVDGTAQAPLAEMVRYVNGSPVGGMLSGLLSDTVATGPARLGLSVRIPLDTPDKTEVRGLLNFADNDLFLTRGVPQLSRVRGPLEFTESGLVTKGLTGQALGGPLKVEANTRPDGTIGVRAEGTATAAALKRFLGVPGSLRASGQTRFAANVLVRPGAGAPDIMIESGLQGIALDLPEPFIKRATDAWPLEFRMLPTVVKNGQLQRDEIRIALASPKGALMAGRIERDRSQGKSNPLRGALAVGEPMIMPEQGIRLNVTLPLLDLDHWQRTQFSDSDPLSDDSIGLGPDTQSTGVGLMPDRVALRTDALIVGNKRFNRLSLVAQHQRNRWNFDIAADEGKGTAVWTPGIGADSAGKLQLNFARLTLPDSQAVQVNTLPPDPTDLFEVPALDITVDDMGLGKIRLGRLRLLAVNEGEGSVKQWLLREFQITNPDGVLTGKGDWRREQPGQPRRTRIDFRLDISNAGRLLDRVGMEKLLRDGAGALTGNLQWKGPPQSFDYETMGGKLNLDIKSGQFLKAEPGVARLLGILSLQSLPRRLTLDFSDIFAAGFAFDQIYASAQITDGILTTRDFKMKGTGASVLMEGKVDLVNETQDLRAVVLPEINAAGGTLMYSVMMANPAVGLATFLAQMVLKDPLSKVFSFDMKVSGTWDDPIVEKVERDVGAPAAGDAAVNKTPSGNQNRTTTP